MRPRTYLVADCFPVTMTASASNPIQEQGKQARTRDPVLTHLENQHQPAHQLPAAGRLQTFLTAPPAKVCLSNDKSVTPAEEFFVSLVISHTSSVYEAIKDELLTKQEDLRRDVGLFFSLPVPKAVWQKTKLLQNQDFAAFIESSLKN
jgi:hypothetical protein